MQKSHITSGLVRHEACASNIDHKVGLAIRRFREADKLSQAALADLAGVTQSTVSYIEKGQNNSLSTLKKIADAFDCPLADIIHAAEKKISLTDLRKNFGDLKL